MMNDAFTVSLILSSIYLVLNFNTTVAYDRIFIQRLVTFYERSFHLLSYLIHTNNDKIWMQQSESLNANDRTKQVTLFHF